MKSLLSFSLCLLLAAVAAPAFAAPPSSDVEHLFGESTGADEQSRSTPDVTSAPPAVHEAATPSYAGRTQWHETANSGAQLDAAAGKKPSQAPREPAAGTSTTMVPEPSAIILALAALVYFLLFGRRRTV